MVNGSNGVCWTKLAASSIPPLYPGKSKFGEDSILKISKKIYQELDERLSYSNYLASKIIQ